MYILDTSAIRGISGNDLRVAATRFEIALPTLSVLELASHLSDSPNDDEYRRARGNLLKCQIAQQILDDPFCLLSQRIQLPVNPTRREDRDILRQLISAAEESPTLAELNAKTLSYADSATASCREIGRNIESILREEENSFVSHVSSLPALANLELDPSQNGTHRLDAATFLGQLTSATQSLSASADQLQTILGTASYFGYLMQRMYYYANNIQPGQTRLPVDGNDCEDAYFSLCLDLNGEDVLVTNDRGTLNALRCTFELLNEALSLSIDSSRVIDITEFLNGIAPRAMPTL